MKKDKLITIRVNGQVRDKFNQWCNKQGLSASEFLSNIIEDCASGDYEMSSNNKERSNKVARQKLIALEAKFEEMSSQLASFTPMTQEGGGSTLQQPEAGFDLAEKVEALEKQIQSLSSQGQSISKLIDDKLDKNDLDGLVESKIHSVFNVESLYQTLDNKLDIEQVEVLVESKIDSLFNFNELSAKLDSKLDKDELEALVKSYVESILIESNLVKQIETKLHNTIDKQEVQTLVKSLVDSTLSQDSLLKVIEKMIDDKLMNQVSPPLEVVEEVSIDNAEDISSMENDQSIIEPTDNQSENAEEVSPEKEVSVEVESEESIAKAIDDLDDTDEQITDLETDIEKQVSQLQEVETDGGNISTESTLPSDLTVIPQAFLALPKGKVETKILAQTLGLSSSARVSELASGKKKAPFPEFWDYMEVKATTKTYKNGKQVNSYDWTKIR